MFGCDEDDGVVVTEEVGGGGVWMGDTDDGDVADSRAGDTLGPPSPSWTIGLLERSLRYSSTQKSSFGFGLGTGRRLAMGLGGILISGRHPNGGGSNDCGDLFRSFAGDLLPFSSFCCGGGGGGALGAPPPGNTCTGIPMLATGIACGVGGCTLGWAKGDGRGVLETPSELALRSIRRAIRGDLICDRSMPPGVYVNGFLSLVIIAF